MTTILQSNSGKGGEYRVTLTSLPSICKITYKLVHKESKEIILLIFQQDAHHGFLLLTYTTLRASFQLTAQDIPYICLGHCKAAMFSTLPFRMVRFGNNPISTAVESYGYHKAKWYYFAFFHHLWEAVPLAQMLFIPQIYQVLSRTSALQKSISESTNLKYKLTGPLRYQQRSSSRSHRTHSSDTGTTLQTGHSADSRWQKVIYQELYTNVI